jgi:hypothetical protein
LPTPLAVDDGQERLDAGRAVADPVERDAAAALGFLERPTSGTWSVATRSRSPRARPPHRASQSLLAPEGRRDDRARHVELVRLVVAAGVEAR